MIPNKKQARIAGALYLLLAITAPFHLVYIPSVLFVSGDPAATAARIRASEGLLRMGIASEPITATIFILVVLALYQLLREVGPRRAVLMVILAVTAIPVSFFNALLESAALIALSGSAFSTPAILRSARVQLRDNP